MSDENTPEKVKLPPAPLAEDAASRSADLDYSFPDDSTPPPASGQTGEEPLQGEDAVMATDSAEGEADAPAALSSAPPAASSDGGGNGGGDEEDDEEDEDEDDEDEDDEEDEEKRPGQSIFDHFRELRARLLRIAIAIVVGFGICWFFHEQIAAIVYHPLVVALPEGETSSIIFTGVAEGFLTHMKLAIVAGIFLMSPFIFYQIWAFIAPGLYSEEKRFILPVAVSSGLCFIAGGLFCYFVVFPNAFRFFMTYSDGPFTAMPSMKEYFGFTMQLMIAFGLIFEMPLFCFFLAKMGVIRADSMRRFRRYFIVIAFILGAFLTPPDPLSQFLMAGPLLLLYEFSILIVSLTGKKKEEDEDDEEDEEEDDEEEEKSKA